MLETSRVANYLRGGNGNDFSCEKQIKSKATEWKMYARFSHSLLLFFSHFFWHFNTFCSNWWIFSHAKHVKTCKREFFPCVCVCVGIVSCSWVSVRMLTAQRRNKWQIVFSLIPKHTHFAHPHTHTHMCDLGYIDCDRKLIERKAIHWPAAWKHSKFNRSMWHGVQAARGSNDILNQSCGSWGQHRRHLKICLTRE